jgi:tetratricopeptide (TPR) repeat protein
MHSLLLIRVLLCCCLYHVHCFVSNSFEARSALHYRATTVETSSSTTDVLLARIDSVLPTTDAFRDAVLRDIQQEHRSDALAHDVLDNHYYDDATITREETLPVLKEMSSMHEKRIALLTTEPLLNATQASLIRELVTDWWKTHVASSRYTYPRASNQEAHLLDLCESNSTLLELARDVLHTKLYPLLQHYFFSDESWKPRVYDSLIIRYNASAAANNVRGAGLPLHRDLGLVSVNIMLNEDFEGGGTLFEAQLSDEQPYAPIKPSGVGHALLHESHQRHAGAGTTSGVRDIWVIFVTAFDGVGATTTQLPPPPPQEVATRLKMKAQIMDEDLLHERALLLKMAIDAVPDDGEAWHHLGMTLHALSRSNFSRETRACLSRATKLIPNDARLFSNFGLVLAQQQSASCQFDNRIEVCFIRSLGLYQGDIDRDSAAFNYGSFLADQGRWEEAISILDSVNRTYSKEEEAEGNSEARATILELQRLCRRQLQQLP